LVSIVNVYFLLVSHAADALRLMIDALSKTSLHNPVDPFDWSKQYLYQDQLYGLEGRPITSGSSSSTAAAAAGGDEEQQRHFGPQWVLLKFDQPVTTPEVRPGLRFCDAHGTFSVRRSASHIASMCLMGSAAVESPVLASGVTSG
jgi:hypothetical protein